jgi:2-polyprenyl-6-methoxyphenol hydroxylase-like FAD-dependent oxidoreductase
VILIGDAAHAMSPAAGQGASFALEDAMVLARMLGKRDAPLDATFARFESARKARAEAMIKQGYENDRRTLNEVGPVGAWMRDHVFMPMLLPVIARALNRVYTEPLPT